MPGNPTAATYVSPPTIYHPHAPLSAHPQPLRTNPLKTHPFRVILGPVHLGRITP